MNAVIIKQMVFEGTEVDDKTQESQWIKKRKESEAKSWGALNLEAEKKERPVRNFQKAEGELIECVLTEENKLLQDKAVISDAKFGHVDKQDNRREGTPGRGGSRRLC